MTDVGSVISDVAKRGITTRQLQKLWAEVVRDCSQWENSTREYTEETRGQFQWNLEPKKEWAEDRSDGLQHTEHERALHAVV